MKKLLTNAFVALTIIASNAQEINFVEFDLDNGLHVILHQDNRAPVITTSVLYHVGSKDEEGAEPDLLTFLNTYYLKELKILKVVSGLKLLKQMEAQIMHILLMIQLTITKFFRQINWN